MIAGFYLIDEADFPSDNLSWAAPFEAGPVIDRIKEKGGSWGDAAIDLQHYADFFEIFEVLADMPDYFRECAIAGSPGAALTNTPGSWRLGYFDAAIVPHLLGVLQIERDTIEAKAEAIGEDAAHFMLVFEEALEEAKSRQLALAITHD